MTSIPYFYAYQDRRPSPQHSFKDPHRILWQVLAVATMGLGGRYLYWRWTASLNADAYVFSVVIALAETMTFIGTLLFFFDIWDEKDTPRQSVPNNRQQASLEGDGAITIDIFIATYNEDTGLVVPTIKAALELKVPGNVRSQVHLLDDGNRLDMQNLALQLGVKYHARDTNRGFKAGNLANAFFESDGDFVVICDADTQLFPTFLENTLGYFRDPKVAWVQTPHWFFDIPEGTRWRDWLGRIGTRWQSSAWCLSFFTGRSRVGRDPFKSDPSMFFDVIQRRRNRHGASFCCGAGSMHRREAVFSNALIELGVSLQASAKNPNTSSLSLLPRHDLQPFRFHVSEDIFTSLQLHQKGWKSVFHPTPEARMLSPWSMKAWSVQKLKYAGGTYDIILNANPLFRRGMTLAMKMHYLATFWSYLAAFWLPLLLFAPVYSLFTGVASVDTYSVEFFAYILPVLLMNELAMLVGTKGHNFHTGRVLSLGTLAIQWRALIQTILGEKPKFPPTPKSPTTDRGLRFALPNLIFLALMASSACWAIVLEIGGQRDLGFSFLIVNLFWLICNALALLKVIFPVFSRQSYLENGGQHEIG